MDKLVLLHEPLIRLGFFITILAAMTCWELLTPRRAQTVGRAGRWPSNLSIAVLNTLLLRFLFPSTAVGFALFVETQQWGLLNAVMIPKWLAVVVAFLILDLAIYLQHILFHAVPVFWRLHRMHHADLEFDVTTGLRFHPIEILLSMGIKLAVIAALGTPAAAVLIFETLLNATSMFNHGNVRISSPIDRVLRMFVVTPDMHRVHHSARPDETNSNFGFNLPWWDRLLGTYRPQPEDGHELMTLGIEQFRTRRDLQLDRLLIQPFRGRISADAVASAMGQ